MHGASIYWSVSAFLLGVGLAFAPGRAECTPQQRAELTASDAGPSDHFGVSAAISADTIVIGAYGDDDDELGWIDSGSAYVFVRSGDAWAQQAKLTAPDAADFDYFGYSVDVDGDTAVVGAYQSNPGNLTHAGAAYVFARSAGVWTQQAKLVAADAADEDWFGFSVAISGETVVIGAHQHDRPGKPATGSAYVFARSNGLWTQQARLYASDAAGYDYFGRSVSVSGDTSLIGAYGADLAGESNAGAAYVFVRSGDLWTQQAKVTASDGAALDDFGFSVALGSETAIIGALYDDNAGGSNAGAAYVFTRAGEVWTQQAKLTASDAAASDVFGRAVAVAGETIVVGANQDDHAGGGNAGAAYVFVRTDGVWTQVAKLTAADAAPSDFLGSSVALTLNTVAAGAMFHDETGANDVGAAYVFCLGCVPADFDCDGDVDQDDVDTFEACASGPNVPLTPGCEDKDFDSDNDTDQSDFGVVQRCLSGANNPADPDCVN